MKKLGSGRRSHQWDRYTVIRVALAISSLVSMILASGASSNWR